MTNLIVQRPRIGPLPKLLGLGLAFAAGLLAFAYRERAGVAASLSRYPESPLAPSTPPQPSPPPATEVPSAPPPPAEPTPEADAGSLMPTSSVTTPASSLGSAPRVDWYGGNSSENRVGLVWMLASENPRASKLAWFLQVLAVNNVARGRKKLGIHSMDELLRSGVRGRRYLQGLGYGVQVDKVKGIKRFAATHAALDKKEPDAAIVEFVYDLLSNTLDPMDLRGAKGERPPAPQVWSSITSFLQHKGFEATLRGQGVAARPERAVVADWGNPPLLAEVDGLRFFGRAAQPAAEATA